MAKDMQDSDIAALQERIEQQDQRIEDLEYDIAMLMRWFISLTQNPI